MAPTSAGCISQLPWRHIGPEGNRVIAVAGVPGDPLVYYAGAASGGIWKTSDGGEDWVPIFDGQPVSAIGALAVAPSDPNVVWAGTGEAFIGWSTNISLGMGIYKSMDAGKTWAQMGLEKTGRIGRLVVDPANANVALACALGHAYGPQPERGVFRTTDGGKSWDRVLFVDENTGCSDIAMNPKNPRILLAGMWQVEVHPWGYDSGGPGSGLFLSRDGGTTWKRVTNGMPKQAVGVGRVGVAIAPSNPNRMYALIETGDGIPWNGKETERGQIWRSEDGGETWRMINADWSAMERTHYYTRMAVAPDNENETYYLTGRYSKSIDGGLTLVPQTRWLDAPATDHHDMWIDPHNASRMIVGSDQGVSISLTRGAANGWSARAAADRADVPRDRGQPDPVQGLRQPRRWAWIHRHQQQPPQRVARRAPWSAEPGAAAIRASPAITGTPSATARTGGRRQTRSIRMSCGRPDPVPAASAGWCSGTWRAGGNGGPWRCGRTMWRARRET